MFRFLLTGALVLGACGPTESGGTCAKAKQPSSGASVGAVSEPRLSSKKEITISGIKVRTSNTLESDPSKALIPALWAPFREGRMPETIPNRRDPSVIYAVYTNYESDYRGKYDLIVGCEVNEAGGAPRGAAPQGMVRMTIPAARYLVFTAQGRMPQALVETWTRIWEYFSDNPVSERAYTADFELHRPVRPNEVQIYVAVKWTPEKVLQHRVNPMR